MPRATKGQPVKADDINLLFEDHEKLKNIRGFGGIIVKNLRSGIYIGLAKLITAATGLAFVQLNQNGGTNAAAISGTLFPPSYRYDAYTAGLFDPAHPANNLLAVSMPLFTPRRSAASVFPAAWGIAIINPSLTMISPGTVPVTGAPTPYRLIWAFETEYEDIDCVQIGSGSGS